MLWLIPSGLKSSRLNLEVNKTHVGLLMTPRTWKMHSLKEHDIYWAGDNDCYTGNFNANTFLDWLSGDALQYRNRCLFVVCPDVVYDAQATLDLYKSWRLKIKSLGYPVALALQDGVEKLNLKWDFDAVFVGGSTEWKMSLAVIELLQKAKSLGKWCHVGRVNSIKRMRHFWGFADSFDGTDYVHHPEESVKLYLPQIRWLKQQLKMGEANQ